MKSIALLLFITFCSTLSAQVKYYKDYEKLKEVSNEKKAKYKRVISTNEEGTRVIEVFNLETGNPIEVELHDADKKPTGVWRKWSDEGTLLEERDFTSMYYGRFDDQGYRESRNDSIYPDGFIPAKLVTKDPNHRLKFPAEAKWMGLHGIVYIRFWVNEDGSVEPAQIYKGVHPFLDLEVWNFIAASPKWEPAKIGGKPVKSYVMMPIRFELR